MKNLQTQVRFRPTTCSRVACVLKGDFRAFKWMMEAIARMALDGRGKLHEIQPCICKQFHWLTTMPACLHLVCDFWCARLC